ncbi:MAG: type II toxin-antitoxin system RelE/ParE family toxin [Oscillospiraceae bacterium]|nr:type II toxin-antitoxin system RelE/ParE family toxin [Oscillospiraceae bacterium]
MKPVILKLARDDLKEIHSKLIEYGNIPPKKFKDIFKTFCDNITTMPYMYPEYDQNPKYRKAVVEYDYLVFYQIEKVDTKERARVYRVLHGKRDILPMLDSTDE